MNFLLVATGWDLFEEVEDGLLVSGRFGVLWPGGISWQRGHNGVAANDEALAGKVLAVDLRQIGLVGELEDGEAVGSALRRERMPAMISAGSLEKLARVRCLTLPSER